MLVHVKSRNLIRMNFLAINVTPVPKVGLFFNSHFHLGLFSI